MRVVTSNGILTDSRRTKLVKSMLGMHGLSRTFCARNLSAERYCAAHHAVLCVTLLASSDSLCRKCLRFEAPLCGATITLNNT